MATTGRSNPAKAARHLRVVPDLQQPALFDGDELGELALLASLRQLAVNTEMPEEALQIIDAAATADDAVRQLEAAGLMQDDEEPLTALPEWFAQLLEPGCDQLDADLAGSAFVGVIGDLGAGAVDVPVLVAAIIEGLLSEQTPEVLAMMRVLAAIGPVEMRRAADAAASRLVSAGLTDCAWAEGLGVPAVGKSFCYADIYGEQVSLVTTFSYGRKPHCVVTLVDNALGGGVKDCYVTDVSPAVIRKEYQAIGSEPEFEFRDLQGAEARAILEQALLREPCPVEPDQIEDVQDCLQLLRARVLLLPAPGPAGTSRGGKSAKTGKPAAAPVQVHRLKITLRGTRPQVWRRVEVPSDISLAQLHRVVMAAFGWLDYHLWVFTTPAGKYGIAEPELGFRSAVTKKLSAVAARPTNRILFEYDFGDQWEHDILVEDVLPARPGVAYPRCTAGRRASPPEDSGGTPGYYRMLRSLADPGSQEHEVYLDRLGIESPGDFDPDAFDLAAINDRLAGTARVLSQ